MATILIHHAAILTLDPHDRFLENAHVLVRDGTIAAVGAGRYHGPETIDRRIDGSGRLLVPGLVNAHTHSPPSTMAGFGDC